MFFEMAGNFDIHPPKFCAYIGLHVHERADARGEHLPVAADAAAPREHQDPRPREMG